VAHCRTRGRGLREDAAGWNGGGVKLVLDVEVDAGLEGGSAGFADGHAGEVGDGDLVAVQGDAQRDGRGEEHHEEHGEDGESEAEEALHGRVQDIGEAVVSD